MPTSQAYFKDSINSKNKKSIVLMTAISHNSIIQEGKSWNDFLNLVENEFKNKKINKLIIITTGYLQRHYFSLESDGLSNENDINEKANDIDDKWLKNNYSNLEKSKIPYEVISWKSLLNKSYNNRRTFDEFLNEIILNYKDNKEFKNLVDDHIDSYLKRKILSSCKENKELSKDDFRQSAINYILEECAALVQFFKFDADILTYPHDINPPAKYIWKKYFKDEPMRYVSYQINNKEKKINNTNIISSGIFKNNAEERIPSNYLTSYVKWTIEKEKWTPIQQYKFIKGINILIDSISSKNERNEESNDQYQKITRRGSI